MVGILIGFPGGEGAGRAVCVFESVFLCLRVAIRHVLLAIFGSRCLTQQPLFSRLGQAQTKSHEYTQTSDHNQVEHSSDLVDTVTSRSCKRPSSHGRLQG